MTIRSDTHTPYSPSEFNQRIAEGVRRAPLERAKAVREFWGWITRR